MGVKRAKPNLCARCRSACMASMALRAAFTTATDTISPSLFMWPVALIDSPIGAKDKLLVNRSEAANCRKVLARFNVQRKSVMGSMTS